MRISITDRCNYRCTYCMPADGLDWLPREELLTFEEIERVARVCVERYGIDSVRLTGGEPTVRHGLPDLVARLARLGVDVAMTTNGSRLATLAAPLAEAPPGPPRPGRPARRGGGGAREADERTPVAPPPPPGGGGGAPPHQPPRRPSPRRPVGGNAPPRRPAQRARRHHRRARRRASP